MFINCNEHEELILSKIGAAADALHMPCFLIGGFVRDKIMNRDTKDMDIVCVGDGIVLAKKVAHSFDPEPFLSVFKNFGTAQLKINDLDIEFVGARKESYRP